MYHRHTTKHSNANFPNATLTTSPSNSARSLGLIFLVVTLIANGDALLIESVRVDRAIGPTKMSSISSELTALAQLPSPLNENDFIDARIENDALFDLGRHLFFDPILSGNKNISCGTCHDPAAGTSDAVALSIGEGGEGKGISRFTRNGVTGLVPRNAQSLYNIGAREYRSLFHDGRLQTSSTHIHGTGFVKLDSEQIPNGLDSLLAKQALFPVTSAIEMAGESGENQVATAVAHYQLSGENGAWNLLAKRLQRLPAYVKYFQKAFDDVRGSDDITYVHVANALAFFQSRGFRSIQSRFDELLKTHDTSKWTEQERQGLGLFYGKAACGQCHSGALLTDHDFHAISMPQIGPGKGHGTDTSYLRSSGFADRLEDEGRYRATLNTEDLFRFRTPSLRNVALTGPWSHAGAYESLEAVIRHHLSPIVSLDRYDTSQVDRLLPTLDKVLDSTGRGPWRQYHPVDPKRRELYDRRRTYVQGNEVLRGRISGSNELVPVQLDDSEVGALVAFLHTMTDPNVMVLSHLIPTELPSGLIPQPSRYKSQIKVGLTFQSRVVSQSYNGHGVK